VRCNTVPGDGFTVEIVGGACRLGLWFVHVWWSGTTVHRVRFATTGIPGEVPDLIRQYCAGQVVSLRALNSSAVSDDTVYSRIYRMVQQVPYGSTSTYGKIAGQVGTSPRVVGQAMAHNPTPLVIPCHRILAAHDIGGFSPSIAIKEALLTMEKKGLQRVEK
jgi:methylated-DNA-[protein]-cysteine S-methyltransferase